jgi:hypothetical protein
MKGDSAIVVLAAPAVKATKMNVEEALPVAEHKAAMLRFLADSAAASKDQRVPEAETFSGMADALAEIERLARTARRSLDAEALGVELKRDRA